jgi:2,4-dienoyl-CoA reductase-like NADH-dependent reductase (Old Yellow Enzyme family)/thioredoxin reductase
MAKYPNLFHPLKINRFTYKNRIVSAPMLFGPAFQNEGEAYVTYKRIEERAKGGAAAVEVGETSINSMDAERLPFRPIDYTRYSGPDFDGFKKYADLIKKYGAVALIELFHAGSEKDPLPGQPNPRGPVGYARRDGIIVDQMDEAMMEKACEDFANAAAFMQAVGFDGILTHSGHGWLFSQFLSPLVNTRTDKYGGRLENRASFPIQIFQRIRKRVGPDFIIEARISGKEGIPGGMEAKEVGQFCKMVEGLIDSVHISAGLYKNPVVTNQFSSMFAKHGCNADFSAIVKQYTSLPVGVVGGINSPEIAEQIIAEGQADFVVLARQMIADPEFPAKAQSGHEAEIRSCLRCYDCFPGSPQAGYTPPNNGTVFRRKTGSCSINPKANLAVSPEPMPQPESSRNVLVVGGGVAGMQAAITAVDRGHRVTLVEKSDKLGGILNFTDVDVNKNDLHNFKNLLIYEVGLRLVNVKLNLEITPALVQDLHPDAIILALGSSPRKLPIPGIDSALHALDVYNPAQQVDQRVVMVGGGLVGCETGLHLAKTGHEVTIIEMLGGLASESFGMYREALITEMGKYKINGKTNTRCLEITPAGVKVENEEGIQEFIPADTVVYALGMIAASTAELRASAGRVPVYEVGDCLKAGNVAKAIEESFMAAMKIV